MFNLGIGLIKIQMSLAIYLKNSIHGSIIIKPYISLNLNRKSNSRNSKGWTVKNAKSS